MINKKLTLLKDIKTVDQLIIKLNELGYTRANDFEQELNEWGEINKYCVSRDEELPFPNTPWGNISINPKSWLNNEEGNCGENGSFVDFSTGVSFCLNENLFNWRILNVQFGENWEIDPNTIYIEKLDENLAAFIKVADKKLEERQAENLRENQRLLVNHIQAMMEEWKNEQ